MKLVKSSIWVALIVAASTSAAVASQSGARYPSIEVYTAPYCRSCKAASEYLTTNGIPFTKKDVTANETYMDEMTQHYKVSVVPLIVIGNGQKVLRGFVPEALQNAVREVMAKELLAKSRQRQ